MVPTIEGPTRPLGGAPGPRLDIFGRVDGEVVIGGVAATEIAGGTGTPAFVTDGDAVLERVDQIRAGFPDLKPQLMYPVKTYANVALLRDLRQAGLGVDVCSLGDLAFARAAGFGDDEISFLGHGTAPDELDEIARHGFLFTADSLAQIEEYGRRVPRGSRIGLRVNPGIGVDLHDHLVAGAAGSKFGIPVSDLEVALTLTGDLGLRPVSLHVHLGSDLLDVDAHVAALRLLTARAEGIPTIERLNLGGGYGVPFTFGEPHYPWAELGRLAAALMPATGLSLFIEPGTALLREAGYLLVRVTEVSERNGKTWVATDGNTNALLGRLLYGTQHPLVAATIKRRQLGAGGQMQPTTVTGNLMLGGDVLAQLVDLPTPAVGDVLVIGLVGAYGPSRTSTFNNRVTPAEAYVRHGQVRLVRRRPSIEDLLAGQVDTLLGSEPTPR